MGLKYDNNGWPLPFDFGNSFWDYEYHALSKTQQVIYLSYLTRILETNLKNNRENVEVKLEETDKESPSYEPYLIVKKI